MLNSKARQSIRFFTLLALPVAVMTACSDDTNAPSTSYTPTAITPVVDPGAAEPMIKTSELVIATAQVGADEPPQGRIFYFETDKSAVNPVDMNALQQHAAYLLGHPHITLTIGGHADERGTRSHNDELSLSRAKEVAAALIALGVPESQLLVQGYGEGQPVADPARWDENRRAELSYSNPNLASAQ